MSQLRTPDDQPGPRLSPWVGQRLSWIGVVRGSPAAFLALLVSVDAALIGIHLTNGFIAWPVGRLFDIGTDRSYGEFFEYVKTMWVVLMLLVVCWRHREVVLAAWAAVFAWYGADNALMLHERAGTWVAVNTPVQQAGLYGQHLGEVVYMVLVLVVAAAGLAVAYRYSGDLGRSLSVRLVVLTGTIVVFGIGVDAVHAAATESGAGTTVDVLLTMVEDGGELVVLSIVAAVLFTLFTAAGSPDRNDRSPGTRDRHAVSWPSSVAAGAARDDREPSRGDWQRDTRDRRRDPE